jgi:hypothetical protein
MQSCVVPPTGLLFNQSCVLFVLWDVTAGIMAAAAAACFWPFLCIVPSMHCGLVVSDALFFLPVLGAVLRPNSCSSKSWALWPVLHVLLQVCQQMDVKINHPASRCFVGVLSVRVLVMFAATQSMSHVGRCKLCGRG